ncbi:OmpH family outer membrane protein [Fulvivirga sp. RKSG066]|uniref:OmpH family outer membrane protein n=1 Tax=Fulvivirga aurantia TaxID=2529383 RepID=UPI0012BCA429|nr:OmpH family outer membrane protein [Fulvivirga aurantia]MTI19718.1 OmpH family outer membrane protein [Fulvivirga aurantia]
MNKTLQLSLFVLFTIALSFLYYEHYSSQRTVYIESGRLINGYQGMIDARKVYQQKANQWKANVDTLANEVQNSIKAYEKESTTMTKKERELSRELIQSKQKQLADYQRAIQEKAGQEDGQMTQQVLEEVNAFIKQYGEKHNYRIIFAATEYGNIAYAEDGLDITDEVLEGLNKQYTGQ